MYGNAGKGVPPFLAETGNGWLTAEYSMMPGFDAVPKKERDGAKQDGRGVEIQRLIGRCCAAYAASKEWASYTVY